MGGLADQGFGGFDAAGGGKGIDRANATFQGAAEFLLLLNVDGNGAEFVASAAVVQGGGGGFGKALGAQYALNFGQAGGVAESYGSDGAAGSGELDDNPVVAKELDDRFLGAELVDAAADDVQDAGHLVGGGVEDFAEFVGNDGVGRGVSDYGKVGYFPLLLGNGGVQDFPQLFLPSVIQGGVGGDAEAVGFLAPEGYNLLVQFQGVGGGGNDGYQVGFLGRLRELELYQDGIGGGQLFPGRGGGQGGGDSIGQFLFDRIRQQAGGNEIGTIVPGGNGVVGYGQGIEGNFQDGGIGRLGKGYGDAGAGVGFVEELAAAAEIQAEAQAKGAVAAADEGGKAGEVDVDVGKGQGGPGKGQDEQDDQG